MSFSKIIKGCFLALCCCSFLISCSSVEDENFKKWAEQTEKKRVLSTTAMIDDLVNEIGGQYISSLVMIQGELDPHSYELVKGDDEKLNRADLIFYNGLGLEHGASLSYYLQHDPKSIAVGDFVLEKYPEKMIFIDHVIDPHIWMDVSIWLEITHPVACALAKLDPDHAEVYFENAKQLRKKMEENHEKIKNIIAEIPQEKRYLVTSHDAFNYFSKTYLATEEERLEGNWHKRFASPEGLTPEGQLSSLDIKRILAHLKEHTIRVIFAESNVSKDSIRKIESCAQYTGFEVVIASDVLFADAMGPDRNGFRPNYIQMIEYNAKMLVDYLK